MHFFLDNRRATEGASRVRLTDGETIELVRTLAGERELHIGVTDKKKITRRVFGRLLRRIIREARARKLTRLAVSITELKFPGLRIAPRELGEIIAVNFELADFEYDSYKSIVKDRAARIESVRFEGAHGAGFAAGLQIGQLIGDEVNGARRLANTPAGDMTPALLAREAQNVAKKLPMKVTVLGEPEMKKLGMEAVLGVARGSSEQPRFIIMEYRGGTKGQTPIVLVGKGVTFDSGGVNIKPTGSIEDMHLDMSGAAMVIHSIVAAAKLKLKKNIVVLAPAVENMVSGSSYRPSDILKSLSGLTIEVTNTDAEGRLILADALTYAAQYKPRLVVDVATLTGAAMVALGQRASAVFASSERLIKLAVKLGEETGDLVWPLPLWDEFDSELKSDFADIRNSGSTRWGGAIRGAMFLKRFAREYPWLHIDMAPRMTSIEGDFLAKGSAGEPVRLLVRLLQRY